MPYSIDALQDDCYPGTSVLINRYDIRDQSKLDEVEGVLTSARSAASPILCGRRWRSF